MDHTLQLGTSWTTIHLLLSLKMVSNALASLDLTLNQPPSVWDDINYFQNQQSGILKTVFVYLVDSLLNTGKQIIIAQVQLLMPTPHLHRGLLQEQIPFFFFLQFCYLF